MNDPKPPHAKNAFGSLSMASGGSKNSATSQFFICLVSPSSPTSSAQLKKLEKYPPFGSLLVSEGGGRVGKDGKEVLEWLDANVDVDKGERPVPGLWIAECGIVD